MVYDEQGRAMDSPSGIGLWVLEVLCMAWFLVSVLPFVPFGGTFGPKVRRNNGR